jgi:hypothetical protein
MATQLIQVPRHLIDALMASSLQERWGSGKAYCPQVAFEAMYAGETKRAVAATVPDRALAWDDWPLHGERVFVLLLTTDLELDRAMQPRPLPDDLLIPVVKATAGAACAAMTGHDALELFSILEAAASQPNALPLAPIPRLPRNRFERRLRAVALCLQHRFSSTLAPLRDEIARYGETLLRSGLGPIIADLSTEGAVADHLALRSDPASGCLRMIQSDPSSVNDLMREVGKARAARKVARWVLEELLPYALYHRRDLSEFHIAELYRHGIADTAPDYNEPLWRSHDLKDTEFPVSVPAIGIEAAVSRLASAFDRRLLGDVDPIVAGVLAQVHLLRISPFGWRDRDAGELLLSVLLRQAGLPPMPLPLVMHRRYPEHTRVLQAALGQGQIDGLVDATISAVKQALVVGRAMIDRLGPERSRLHRALADIELAPSDATDLTTELLSQVLVRHWSSRELVPVGDNSFETEMPHLHAAGLVELVEAGGRKWWSSPVARSLVSSGA